MQRHTGPILSRKDAACGPLAFAPPCIATYARAEWVPIKSPDKRQSHPLARTRRPWSGARALCTRGADQRFNGGGGLLPLGHFGPPGRQTCWSPSLHRAVHTQLPTRWCRSARGVPRNATQSRPSGSRPDENAHLRIPLQPATRPEAKIDPLLELRHRRSHHPADRHSGRRDCAALSELLNCNACLLA